MRRIEPSANYEPTIARWVWSLEDTRQRTKHCLDGIAPDTNDWTAPDGNNSIGALLYHLVAIEMSYLYEDILEIGWSAELEPLLIYDVRDEYGRLTPIRGESIEAHLDRLDAGRALMLNALSEMTLDEFYRPRQVEDYVVTPEWILHHLMQHEAEHRGQISAIRFRAEKVST